MSVAQQSKRQQKQILQGEGRPTFTNNMLNQLYDDNASIKVSKMPSNLVEVPRVNEKYEIASFFGQSAQFKENLRTMTLIQNMQKDPLMNLNPSFYS